MDMSSSKFANGNSGSEIPKFSHQQADEVINGLIVEYGTPDFKKWYGKLVYAFGPQKVLDLQARCRDARSPGKIFSMRAKELMDAYEARQRFDEKNSEKPNE